MTDIVERLRALVILDEVGSDNPLGREAADEIERLRAALDDECAAHRICVEMRDIANAEIERLRAQVRELMEKPLHIPIRSDEDTTAMLERHIRKAMREP